MTTSFLVLVLGLGLLTGGAELLVKGASSLARRLGLTPLVIGLTIVAFGTSAPELVVSIQSSLGEMGDIALGNVVGSNIFNIGMILGLVAIISPLNIQLSLLRIDAPIMIAVSILCVGLTQFESIPRAFGVVLVLLLLGYTVFSIRLAKKTTKEAVEEEFEEGVFHSFRLPWLDAGSILGGLILLVLGSQALVSASISIARSLNVSEAVIGLTIVAAGTSMPELATSLVAAVRRQSDISVGNIIGSNIFNILGILGVSATIHPFSAPGIRPLDLGVMLVYAVALLPLLWTGRKLQRGEGALLLGGYLVYLWALWPKS